MVDPLGVLGRSVTAIQGTSRPGQDAMCTQVASTLTEGGIHMAQAGTGTGKSLAYLSAALTAAVETGERAIISTATLALQRQIIGSDAPLVGRAVAQEVGREPTIALLKGWHNYVCVHKIAGGYPVDEAMPLPLEGSSVAGSRTALGEQIQRLRTWAAETTTGDRDDLVPGVGDRAWRQVSVTKLACLGAKCPVRDDCFAEHARREAHAADVVVTNHAMLGVAATGSPGVLPAHSILVVDEAHDLAARVTQAASVELSVASVERIRGLARHAPAVVEKLAVAVAGLRAALEELLPGRLPEIPPALADAALLLGAAAREGVTLLGGEAADEAGARAVAKAELVVLGEICDRVTSGTVGARKDVAWVDRGRDGSDPPRLNIAPLEVGGLIREHLIADRAVVATSATLQLGGSFEGIARTFGLGEEDREWTGSDYGSPFDYPNQGILYVAAHVPRPGRDGVAEEALAELVELVAAAGGGTLGLFSSLRGAQRAADYVRERVATPVLCQGEEQLPQLVQEFAADREASLFGTLSLWQGVDVPGDTCRLVVIDRIPFPRPDDPIMSARTEVAERAGRSGFLEVSVSHAALLLAQGAGRLIRNANDRGVVALLDPRIVTASYGRFLVKSLPGLWPTRDPELVRASLRALAGKAKAS